MEKIHIPEGLISKTVSFDHKMPISKVMPAVRQYGAVIVNRDRQYEGIVDSRSIYRSKLSLNLGKAQTIGKIVTRVPKITNSTTMDSVIYYFYKSRVKALPYMDNSRKIKGILTRWTLLKAMLSMGELGAFTVSDSMSSPVMAIDINSTLTQARAAMRDNKVNRLAVLEGGRFVGLLTNHDIINFAKPGERLPEMKTKQYNPSNITIDSVMQRTPHTVDQGAPLPEAVKKMVENEISSLVVVKQGKPVGMLTIHDVFESLVAKGQVRQNRIFISGLDQNTYEYEDEIREEINSFMGKIEKLNRMNIDYITLNVKHIKTKSYEIRARLAIAGRPIITVHVNEFLLERAMAKLTQVLREEILKGKEKRILVKKVAGSYEEE
ncbi:MAG: CBS domain-containing protein [Candidatus Micrarchaeota archaeon]|nr:CBS domain-containing protein [Candidatus Micrarchaeota archaeon]